MHASLEFGSLTERTSFSAKKKNTAKYIYNVKFFNSTFGKNVNSTLSFLCNNLLY